MSIIEQRNECPICYKDIQYIGNHCEVCHYIWCHLCEHKGLFETYPFCRTELIDDTDLSISDSLIHIPSEADNDIRVLSPVDTRS